MSRSKRLWSIFLTCFVFLVGMTNLLWGHFSSLSDGERKEVMTVSSSEEKSDLPAVSLADWQLILVNRNHPTDVVPPSLAKIEEVEIDSRILEAAKGFLEAARRIDPEETVISGYRSREAQTELYTEAVAAAEEAGLSHEEAESAVQKQIQLPGASEHQTGLALDMSAPAGQEDEVALQIAALAPEYGFVLRYPDGKSEVTGVDFENWHYRYVGIDSAKYMANHGLVLEEYLALLLAAGK